MNMETLGTSALPRQHRHFEDELERLRRLLIRMASLVDEQVELASRCILSADTHAGEFLLSREARVNEYDLMVDALCHRILALTQPVAIDLRTLIAAMRFGSEFERMGDIATNIVDCSSPLRDQSELLERIGLHTLMQEGQGISRIACDAFINMDASTLTMLFEQGQDIEQRTRRAFDTLIGLMKDDPSLIEPGAHAMALLRHIEGLADHAMNIIEDVLFVSQGSARLTSNVSGPAPVSPGTVATSYQSVRPN